MSSLSSFQGASHTNGRVRRAVAATLLGVVLVFGQILTAEANHFTFLSQDASKEEPPQGPENFVHLNWWMGQPISWWAESSVLPDAQAVISRWLGNPIWIPRFYTPADSAGSAHLRFLFSQQPDCPIAARQMVMAHETGHEYGLHERYWDQGGPPVCQPEVTVMDGMSGGTHCHGLNGPVANPDVDRVGAVLCHGGGDQLERGLFRRAGWSRRAMAVYGQRLGRVLSGTQCLPLERRDWRLGMGDVESVPNEHRTTDVPIPVAICRG